MVRKVSDINIRYNRVLPSPEELLREVPRSPALADFVADSRQALREIIFGQDDRLLVIAGPCSIHDTTAALEYARKLAALADELSGRLCIVMRVYFEKPRTTVGWKGLIMDPHLDGTYDIPEGLRQARSFLREVLGLGLPTATELLDPITPQYIADLICWSAIGARTAESQTHRQMASGLSMPLGFKNGTGGNIQLALNGIKAALQPQTFLGVSPKGQASAVSTLGNPNCHLILRGGENGPNCSPEAIAGAEEMLIRNQLRPSILVDCSHANSGKDPARQPEVLRALMTQIQEGNRSIIGVMLESFLAAGSQPFPRPMEELVYGQSITDGCIDWNTTEELLREVHDALPIRGSGTG